MNESVLIILFSFYIAFSPYRAVKKLQLDYTNQSVNVVWEIMAVCSEILTKHINILCGQNVELLNVKLVVHIVTTGF